METRAIAHRGIEWISVAQELHDTKMKIEDLESQEKKLTNKLKNLSKNRNAVGGPFLFIQLFRKGAIQYDAIPELKDVDLEMYRKDQVSSWILQRVD